MTLKFPHISLFRNVLEYVRHVNTDPLVPAMYRITEPVHFGGAVKLHGGNCGVVWTREGDTLQPQSREVELFPGQDYAGFAAFVAEHEKQILGMFHTIDKLLTPRTSKLVLHGEWVGKGVVKRNKGSAVSKMEEKRWVLFAFGAVLGDEPEGSDFRDVSEYLVVMAELNCTEGRIANILNAGTWNITIDFSDPASIEAGREEAARLTAEVEKQCPFGALYGVEGAGEGIVWTPWGLHKGRDDLRWKCKGEAHSVIDTKLVKERPVVPADVQARIEGFLNLTVTSNRLHQGLDVLEQQGLGVERRSTGKFVQWLTDDVERECVLELKDADLEWSQVKNEVTTRARLFFLVAADSEQKLGKLENP